MDDSCKLIKVSSILNFTLAVFAINIPVYREFLFIIGFILFVLSDEDNINIYGKTFTKIAIILLPFNIISSTLIFIASDKIASYNKNVNGINAPPSSKKNIDQETKKIDILLKIGVGMIFASGILFATTSWNFISNPIKALVLIILGIIFHILSSFSEKRLHIYKTTYLYWILGMTFFLLTIIGIEYFGIFGNYLTYNGLGKYLAYTITYLVIAGLSFATYLKFPKKYLIYLIYFSITLTLYCILKHFNLSNLNILLIVMLPVMFFNIFTTKNSTISKYSNLLSYMALPLYIKFIPREMNLMILITGIICIINNYYLITKNENNDNALILLFSHILFFIVAYHLENFHEFSHLVVVLYLSLSVIATKFNITKVDKITIELNYLFYTFVTFILFCVVLITKKSTSVSISVIISILFLLVTIVASRKIANSKKMKLPALFETISLLFTIIALSNIKFINPLITSGGVIAVTLIIYTFVHMILKDTNQKKICLFSIIIGTAISLLLIKQVEAYEAILLLIPSIYLFYDSFINDRNNNLKLCSSYLLLLLTAYNILVNLNLFSFSIITSNIIYLIILIGIIFLLKIELLKRFTYLTVIIPLSGIVNELELYSNIKVIIASIIILYLTFLAAKFICKSKESKNVILIIGIVFALLEVSGITDTLTGIYIGIVGLVVMMIGYSNKDLTPLFITGIIITIKNILYQLRALWGKIPFWLYLLLGGFALIIFVTYKELKKTKEK